MHILNLFLSASSSETDEVQKLYESELLFIEACLKVNPKSYGCWHHRTWVNTRLPRPDWTRELGLCDRCLGLDERNCTTERDPSPNGLCVCTFLLLLTCVSPASSPSPLLGLPPHGGQRVRGFCRAGAAVYRSPDWLQFLQLLQLALPEHAVTSAPPPDSP